MSNRYHIKIAQVSAGVRKSRFVEPNTGLRVKQFTEDDLQGTSFQEPRLNDGNTQVAVMAFEGTRPQCARVTSDGGMFDRVEIWARNENFLTDRPIYLRVRRGGVPIYVQPLKLSDFDANDGFVKKQIKLGMTIEDDGSNYDIDLEQDELKPLVERKFCRKTFALGDESVIVLAEPEEGEAGEMTLYEEGTPFQQASGRFLVSEIKLLGEARTATEFRADDQSGNLETVTGEPYEVPRDAIVRGELTPTEKTFNLWYEKVGEKNRGEYVEKASGIPNIYPFAPAGIVRENHPQR